MRRKQAHPEFMLCVLDQVALQPPSYEEMIQGNLLVRFVDEVVEKIDHSSLKQQYKADGTSSYRSKMFIKVFTQKRYTPYAGSFHFHWLTEPGKLY